MVLRISSAKLLVPLILSTTAYSSDENVEGVLHYTDKTVDVYEVQDLEEAASDKHNYTVRIHQSIKVTEKAPQYEGSINDEPCWGQSFLFNLSNYVFQGVGSENIDLTFRPTTADAKVGKVVRNGRAEFSKLRNLTFSDITNTKADVEGTFTPFQPYTLEGGELGASTDILASYGYGGAFTSASGLTNDENGGVGIYDGYGSISFSNITYDGSSIGDVNCGIHLSGGAIYADETWNTEIKRNSDEVSFSNVYITLDRSSKYANSSSCYFYAYGGAIHTRDLCIDDNNDAVRFVDVGIRQVAVHHDEGYGYGGALYLKGSANSMSDNTGDVQFVTCTINVANTAKGGAVFLADNTTLDISHNGGEIYFIDCEANASAIDGALNDDATAQGGAIYLSSNATLNIEKNGIVIFEGNAAAASVTQKDGGTSAQGGAIYGGSGSHLRICDNKSVYFAENSASLGSAIYTQGNVTICDNLEVSFISNSGSYAVYMDNRESILTLSGDINFSYNGLYTAGTVEFNAPYNDTAQTGEIEFYASTALIDRAATLYNGTLVLRQGSSFSAASLTLTSDAILAAEGQGNSISLFELGTACTLALTLGSFNTTEAVLRTPGFWINGSYTLDITFQGRPQNGREYILLELTAGLPYSDLDWNEDRVHVTGDVTFSDLYWTNDYTRLVYRVIPEPTGAALVLVALTALAARRSRRK